MVGTITYTLHADGTSDRSLMPVIDWLFGQHFPSLLPDGEFADLGKLQSIPTSLAVRIVKSIELYPCDVLFIHRDAEAQPPADRIREIKTAVDEASKQVVLPHYVCIIPVRMQEAWLLFDKQAIRRAAGNPNGKVKLALPSLKTIEDKPDPKALLYALLETASELQGRRLAQFPVTRAAVQVAENIQDFSPLRTLSAFRAFEDDVQNLASQFQSE